MSTWKKIMAVSFIGLGWMMFGLAKPASAAISADIAVTVTVRVISVQVGSTTWAIAGVLNPSDIAISSAIPVTNDGNITETYQLSLDDTESDWSFNDAQAPAPNQYVMLGLFSTTPVGTMVDGNFGEGGSSDDVIIDTNRTSAADQFGITAEGESAKGYNVGTGNPRNLFLDFRAPSSNSYADQQYITVTVTATAS